jgi:dihydrodipicolinate synthase/N-acetylneuraminate lyase
MGLFGQRSKWEGVVGCPLTPFDGTGGLDLDGYARQVEFLLGSGTPALCAVMHVGESLNLSVAERRLLAERTVRVVDGRAPVIVHVSCPGTDHAVDLARHAEIVGADAVVAMTPYHWHPSEEGLYQHFLALGEAVDIPLLVYSPPPSVGVPVSGALTTRLIDRLPRFLGIKDASNQLPVFSELASLTRAARPDFSLFTGVEYLLPSMMLGGSGSFSICGLVAPRLIRSLWLAVAGADYPAARSLQEQVSRLLAVLVPNYPATLKAAAELMGRGLGPTRLPVPALTRTEKIILAARLAELGVPTREPYGWDVSAAPDPDRVLRAADIRWSAAP